MTQVGGLEGAGVLFEKVLLNGSYQDMFSYLDPYGYLKNGKLHDRVCIGTALTGIMDRYDDPVGLLVCRVTAAGLVIEWVFVDPSWRFKGIGTGLVNSVLEESLKRGFDKFYAYTEAFDSRSKVCPGELDFLGAYNMERVKENKNTAKLYRTLIPKQKEGAFLYCADVRECFERIRSAVILDDILRGVSS